MHLKKKLKNAETFKREFQSISNDVNAGGSGSPTSNLKPQTLNSFRNILSEVENGILKITINRPDKLNALNHLTIQEIGMAVESGAKDSSVVGIIITGMGDKAFVAGATFLNSQSFSPGEKTQH